MASISADTFTVNRGQPPLILYDHGRKYRTRRFILYIDGTAEKQFVGLIEPGTRTTTSVRLPAKMAFALHLAYSEWRKTQR